MEQKHIINTNAWICFRLVVDTHIGSKGTIFVCMHWPTCDYIHPLMQCVFNCTNSFCFILVCRIHLHLTLSTINISTRNTLCILLWILLGFNVDTLSNIISLFYTTILLFFRTNTFIRRNWWSSSKRNLACLFLSWIVSSYQFFFFGFLLLDNFLMLL